MKLRDWLTIALLCLLIGSAYAFMQRADEESAARELAVAHGKPDK
ncbi:hypothetical protein [Duganella lactea]|nr:hypothetical protein [Duganella lactea]